MNNIYIERDKAIFSMNKAKGEAAKLEQENIKLKIFLKEVEFICTNSIEKKDLRGFGVIYSMIKIRF